MDEDMELLWRNLKLTDEEQVSVEIMNMEDGNAQKKEEFCCFCKLLTTKPYNKNALKNTMKSVWNTSKGPEFRILGENLMLVQFHNMVDKRRVMQSAPWSFDNHLVLLEDYNGEAQPSNLKILWSPFWVRIFDLPFNSMKGSIGEIIGNQMGKHIETDLDSNGHGWGRFLRIRVMLNVEKPLLRGINIRGTDGRTIRVYFQYERSPIFCYYCGRLGHGEKECEVRLSSGELVRSDQPQYGAWLRAPERKKQHPKSGVGMDEGETTNSGDRSAPTERPLAELGNGEVMAPVMASNPPSTENSVGTKEGGDKLGIPFKKSLASNQALDFGAQGGKEGSLEKEGTTHAITESLLEETLIPKPGHPKAILTGHTKPICSPTLIAQHHTSQHNLEATTPSSPVSPPQNSEPGLLPKPSSGPHQPIPSPNPNPILPKSTSSFPQSHNLVLSPPPPKTKTANSSSPSDEDNGKQLGVGTLQAKTKVPTQPREVSSNLVVLDSEGEPDKSTSAGKKWKKLAREGAGIKPKSQMGENEGSGVLKRKQEEDMQLSEDNPNQKKGCFELGEEEMFIDFMRNATAGSGVQTRRSQ